MNIDVLTINALLESFMKVLTNMAGMELRAGLKTDDPEVKTDTFARGDVSSVMSLSGPGLNGSVAISFTTPVILDLSKRMFGEEDDNEETALDLTGEITNMVVGGTKRILSEKGFEIDMASPAMFSGPSHEINHNMQGATILIPFYLESGKVFLEVNFDENVS